MRWVTAAQFCSSLLSVFRQDGPCRFGSQVAQRRRDTTMHEVMGHEPRRAGMPGDVTGAEWERRKAFVGFTSEDADLLRTMRPMAEASVDGVVEELYRRFLAFEETRAFFSDPARLARVKAMQKQYFLGLTGGDYGEAYLRNRLEIGRVHQRIGLLPRWYMGAYSIYMQLVVPQTLTVFDRDLEKGQRALLALLRIITLDKELAVTTYIAAGEEIITRQSQEIMEISTPVIQVWDGVVVAPLIGTLDSQRTRQFMERLLERIVETNSPVSLVDITGVPIIDTKTAQHLIETITAVRLLGAQVVLTGIRPAIAQTLVHLGIDLSGVTTRSSLAAGLRVAFDLLNLHVVGKEARGS
jgi:rsbT co-antagonist protein RsbR